jgi:hypothetical protein
VTERHSQFEDTPFGPLYSGTLGSGGDGDDCLVWYDGPLLWLCADAKGGSWLVNALDDDWEQRVTTLLVIPVSGEDETALRRMTAETDIALLNRLYSKAEDGWKVVESWDGRTVAAAPASAQDYAEARPSSLDLIVEAALAAGP